MDVDKLFTARLDWIRILRIHYFLLSMFHWIMILYKKNLCVKIPPVELELFGWDSKIFYLISKSTDIQTGP